MNREQIIRMAREAGLFDVSHPNPAGNSAEVERFAALVAAAEREECAKVCDELAELNRKAMTDSMWQQEECAAAIRARGQQ